MLLVGEVLCTVLIAEFSGRLIQLFDEGIAVSVRAFHVGSRPITLRRIGVDINVIVKVPCVAIAVVKLSQPILQDGPLSIWVLLAIFLLPSVLTLYELSGLAVVVVVMSGAITLLPELFLQCCLRCCLLCCCLRCCCFLCCCLSCRFYIKRDGFLDAMGLMLEVMER